MLCATRIHCSCNTPLGRRACRSPCSFLLGRSLSTSIVAETPLTDEAERCQLRMAIIKAGMTIDVTITNVYLVPPRFLVKSSAGKPSRSANKERVIRLRDQCNLAMRSVEFG
jgi:hypothetical protein